ncbi:maleylpyruvate isomerase N-terminal domain-containing protein [Terracoccus sp. 273MFTsu3.1]|uniref:maleylpyruvate isomerase N-terminal domain-containing protein n=1 Tax=Terracoccus sp. 273MFTsu3.1 TaxID=1172188 RepID=UPI00037BFA50|nr:maleylpyruvate isomerase N-terminal domain-containing protein [Terracoccus sp. 273MFTsu3.1]
MTSELGFSDLLRLIDDRSRAFRSAVSTADVLDVQVPTCPDWTLLDLVHHLGTGRRSWAATVAAGPDATSKLPAPTDGDGAVPSDPEALDAWLAASTGQLVQSLREAGPERGCWTWWGDSQSPQTCGAVARHQLQEIAVHAYDAQLTAGAPQPLPDDVALDGVEEFLSTCCSTTSPWPHEPAVVDYVATEGRAWRQWVDADGSRYAPLDAAHVDETGDGEARADARMTGSASDVVLVLYGRHPLDSLTLEGDREVFDRLVAWEPE